MTTTRSAWISRRNSPLCTFAVATLTLATSLGIAQQPLAHPPANPIRQALAFEVASIHPHQGEIQRFMDFSSSGPRVRLEGYNLRGLIMEAYNIRNFQVSVTATDAQPDTNYDIVAVAPEGTAPTRDEFRRMLQTLLADRFQLKAHIEKRPMPVYALVVGKGGPKLEPPSEPSHELHGLDGRNKFVKTDSITMYDLANDIWDSFMVDRPVIDRTDLTGAYKLRIEATPEFRINGDPQPGDLSIFTAVQEQLGLKLEPSTFPLNILVIDSAQKPSEN
jgi:uncharacterized protein (TIGR03435 family)